MVATNIQSLKARDIAKYNYRTLPHSTEILVQNFIKVVVEKSNTKKTGAGIVVQYRNTW